MNQIKLPWEIKNTYDGYVQSENGSDNIIDHVVLAEFDIDTGSTVRYQYPEEVPYCSSDWLAENMLPEGVHNRDEDWTYMFLNRKCRRIDQIYAQNGTTLAPSTLSDTSSDSLFFLYGMNLVRNKRDANVRRGAVVKAMAIFSKYPFVESFKGALTCALEHYYANPQRQILKEFFDQINEKIIASVIPRPNLKEQLLMRRGVAYYPQCISNNYDNQYKPQAWLYKTQVQFHFTKNPESNESRADAAQNPKMNPILMNSPMDFIIPLYRTAEEVGPIDLTRTISLLRDGIMKIFHAILTKQRVLFCGYNHSAVDIASVVFSCVSIALTSSLTHSNILSRVFPYANLSDLSFLEVSGYISGVTNPMFQTRYDWYDVLVVLDMPNNQCKVFTSNDKRVEDGQIVPNATPAPPSVNSSSNALNSNASALRSAPVEYSNPISDDKVRSSGSDRVSSSSPSSGDQQSTSGANKEGTTAAKHSTIKHSKLSTHASQLHQVQAQAAQMQLAARLHHEEVIAHEVMDMRFISNLLHVLSTLSDQGNVHHTGVGTVGQMKSTAMLPMNIEVESWIKQQFVNYSNVIVHQALDLLYASNKLVTKDLRRYSLRSTTGHCSVQQSYNISEKSKKMFAANGYRARLLAEDLNVHACASSVVTNGESRKDVNRSLETGLEIESKVLAASGSIISNVEVERRSDGDPSDSATTSSHTVKGTLSPKKRHSFAEEFALGVEAGLCSSGDVAAEDADSPTGSENSAVEYMVDIYIMRLRYESKLHSLLEVQTIYNYILKHLKTESACQHLCSVLTDSIGGLSILCNGFFNPNPNVRYCTTCICEQLASYPSTRHMVASMNSYYKSSYNRCKQQIREGSLVDSAKLYENQFDMALHSLQE